MTAPTAPAPITVPSDRIRQTATWLIGAYAAVGSAVATGLTLTLLKDARDDHYALLAAVGFGLAIVGILAAIGCIARVLTSFLYDSRPTLEHDATTYPEYFQDAMTPKEALTAMAAANAVAQNPAFDAVTRGINRRTSAVLARGLAAWRDALTTVEFHKHANRNFVASGVCAAVAALGALLFAYSVSRPDKSETALQNQKILLATAKLNTAAAQVKSASQALQVASAKLRAERAAFADEQSVSAVASGLPRRGTWVYADSAAAPPALKACLDQPLPVLVTLIQRIEVPSKGDPPGAPTKQTQVTLISLLDRADCRDILFKVNTADGILKLSQVTATVK